jgi:hypothetical protein
LGLATCPDHQHKTFKEIGTMPTSLRKCFKRKSVWQPQFMGNVISPSNRFSVLFFFILFFSLRPVLASAQTLNPSASPIPANNEYLTEVSVVHQKDEIQTTLSLFQGEKKLWEDAQDCGYGFKSRVICWTTGRSFFALSGNGVEKIVAYSKNGEKLLDIPGWNMAPSENGVFVVYELSDGKTVVIRDIDRHRETKFQTKEACLPQALSDDGKYVLLLFKNPDGSTLKYVLVDWKGNPIWEKSGFYNFGKIIDQGGQITFFNTKKKTLEHCDLASGKTLSEMPMAVLKLLNFKDNHQGSIRSSETFQ